MCLSCTVLPFWSLPIIANCFSRLQLTSELFFGQFNRNMWEIDTISWYYARTFNWIFLYLLGFSHWIYHLLFFFGVVMYWLFIGDKLSCYLRDLLSIWSEELPEIIGFFFIKNMVKALHLMSMVWFSSCQRSSSDLSLLRQKWHFWGVCIWSLWMSGHCYLLVRCRIIS